MPDPCPICDADLLHPPRADTTRSPEQAESYDCPRCGRFELALWVKNGIPQALREKPTLAGIVSHAIRRMHPLGGSNARGGIPFIDQGLWERLASASPPTPAAQADNCILWLGAVLVAPGEILEVDTRHHRAILGSLTDDNFDFVFEHLRDQELIKGPFFSTGGATVTLTFKGWERFEELKRGVANSHLAFMAMPFGEARLDHAFWTHWKPAVAKTGFDLRRIDEKPKAGSIDDRLRVEILRSRFLIAELTDGNHGAYWEAGFAEGLRRPVIYMCTKDHWKRERTHFDTNHLHTIIWEETALGDAAEQLKATIRATLPDEATLSD